MTVMAIGFKYLIFYKDIDEAFELRCTYIEELTQKLSEEREGEGGDQVSILQNFRCFVTNRGAK